MTRRMKLARMRYVGAILGLAECAEALIGTAVALTLPVVSSLHRYQPLLAGTSFRISY